MQKHAIQNLAVAIIVPTILFAIALLGTRHINMPQAAVDTLLKDSITDLQARLEAEAQLCDLKFDSLEKVFNPERAKFWKDQGYNYFVDLDWLFPNSELKGLRAYTKYPFFTPFDNFFFDGGEIGNSTTIAKKNGIFYLITNDGTRVLIGKVAFDLQDDLWHNLADYGRLTNATIILLVSLMIIFLSYFLYHPKSELVGLLPCITILLGGVWLYGYNESCGEDKFYDFKNIILLYITLCWLCCIIALFIPLEEKQKLIVKEQKEEKENKGKELIEKEKRTKNGVDTQYFYKYRWLEVENDSCSLTFNMDGTAFYTDENNIEIYDYSVNTDWSIILTKGEKRFFVRHRYYRDIDSSQLLFKGKSFTKSGKSIEAIRKEHYEKEKQQKFVEDTVKSVTTEWQFSCRGILVAVFMLLVVAGGVIFFYFMVSSSLWITIFVAFVLAGFAFHCYSKYLTSKIEKLKAICHNAYGKLSKDEMPDYLRYCLKHGEISIEEYSKLDEGKES